MRRPLEELPPGCLNRRNSLTIKPMAATWVRKFLVCVHLITDTVLAIPPQIQIKQHQNREEHAYDYRNGKMVQQHQGFRFHPA